MARCEKLVEDKDWHDVRFINSYALFIGYMSMAIKGVGFLVLTWTTVVLLGGFVSTLQKEDFWCLTFITLVQTAGIFDVFMNEKLSYIGKSIWGLVAGVLFAVVSNEGDGEYLFGTSGPANVARVVIGAVAAVVQVMVLAILLCPLAAVYMFGLLFSTGISLWRLIQHDYRKTGGDATQANLKPALDVLYSLALLQGLLFCYRAFFSFTGKKIAKIVAYNHGDHESVMDYLRETRIGCEKDPSFVRGRNIITYAVDLIGSKLSDDYLSGLRILDTVVSVPGFGGARRRLLKHLILSISSGHIFHKLLLALDSTSPCGTEATERAARIVTEIAGDIRLEHFPQGIQCISSLLDTSQKNVHEYKEMLLKGLHILGKLVADEDNCRVMSDRYGLLSKIMKPVSSDLLHCIDHDAWSDVVDASLEVLCCWLTTATGEAGAKLRREISSNKEAVNSMQFILKCDSCNAGRCILAIKILTQLSTENRGNSIEKLVHIFIGSDPLEQRELAGEKLATLSFESQSNAKIILQQEAGFIGTLSRILLEDESKGCRISAAGIMEGLCSHYNKDDDCLKNLEILKTDVMPKVLRQILPRESTEAQNGTYSTEDADIEGQNAGVPRDNDQNVEKVTDEKLLVALLSLCVMVYDKLISSEKDLALLFGDNAFSFPKRLTEMTTCWWEVGSVGNLKLISKMAISMMRHKGSYVKEDLESLIQSLSRASTNKLNDESYMLLSGGNAGASTTKPFRTLASLVKEARKLMDQNNAQEIGEIDT